MELRRRNIEQLFSRLDLVACALFFVGALILTLDFWNGPL